jgi:hypothetical protein
VVDRNDKAACCRLAQETLESRFIAETAPRYGLNAIRNPECAENYCAPDLIIDGMLADLKWRSRPFFKAEELYGVPCQYALTLNVAKISRYLHCWPEMRIYAYLEWPREQVVIGGNRYRVSRKQELWVLTMQEIEALVWHAPIHTYRERSTGNATASYVVNLLSGERLSRHGEDVYRHDRSTGGRRCDVAAHSWMAPQPGQGASISMP